MDKIYRIKIFDLLFIYLSLLIDFMFVILIISCKFVQNNRKAILKKTHFQAMKR